MPRSRHVQAWDNRSQVADSKNNHCYHTHFKQFFDKKSGIRQYTDQYKYLVKTPANGVKEFSYYDNRVKYYWDRRQPVDPESQDRFKSEELHANF